MDFATFFAYQTLRIRNKLTLLTALASSSTPLAIPPFEGLIVRPGARQPHLDMDTEHKQMHTCQEHSLSEPVSLVPTSSSTLVRTGRLHCLPFRRSLLVEVSQQVHGVSIVCVVPAGIFSYTAVEFCSRRAGFEFAPKAVQANTVFILWNLAKIPRLSTKP